MRVAHDLKLAISHEKDALPDSCWIEFHFTTETQRKMRLHRGKRKLLLFCGEQKEETLAAMRQEPFFCSLAKKGFFSLCNLIFLCVSVVDLSSTFGGFLHEKDLRRSSWVHSVQRA